MTYYYDMDGTFVDLYGVENWLDSLLNEDTRPYDIAHPLISMVHFAKILHKIQQSGNKIGVISWTSKGGSNEYNVKVAEAKRQWLKRHLPSVEWDEIKIVAYGTPKYTLATINDILFDDEKPNRDAWQGESFLPSEIFTIVTNK